MKTVLKFSMHTQPHGTVAKLTGIVMNARIRRKIRLKTDALFLLFSIFHIFSLSGVQVAQGLEFVLYSCVTRQMRDYIADHSQMMQTTVTSYQHLAKLCKINRLSDLINTS